MNPTDSFVRVLCFIFLKVTAMFGQSGTDGYEKRDNILKTPIGITGQDARRKPALLQTYYAA
ncbi:MAG TPA: hypothetical protein VFZ52_21070 [Chryseolinea sp.]